MHEKLGKSTVEVLKTVRNWTAIAGVALIGADILAGPELNGVKYIGLGAVACSFISGTLIKHENHMKDISEK